MFKHKPKPIVPENTIVTSDTAHVKTKKTSKIKKLNFKKAKPTFTKIRFRKRSIVAAFVVVLAGVLSAYYFFGRTPSGPPLKETQTEAVQHAGSVVDAYLASSEQNNASLDAAVAKLTALEDRSTSESQKEAYAGAVVELYDQAGYESKAFNAAVSAEETYHSALSAARLANMYELKKDYNSAIEYFQIAAERSPKTGPTERSAYNDYLNEVKRIEALL